jgi:hypothetical protein
MLNNHYSDDKICSIALSFVKFAAKVSEMFSKWYCIILFLLTPFMALPQSREVKQVVPGDTISVAKDTTLHYELNPVDIFPDKKDMAPKQLRQYSLLELKVRKVYPMAKVAAIKLAEYNRIYTTFKTERERKNYVKGVEKELFTEFEDTLRRMKVSEGRILIKLLDRETGNSSYEIIKEFKGGFSAFFWQSVAKLFGHDLKAQYDPTKEDIWIECIIQQIDLGLI